MKKYIVGGLVGATLMFSAQGFAADAIEKVEAYIKNQPVKLNGQAVTLESPALVYDGSTYLKLRDAAKLTGLSVNWNEQTQTVELENGTSPQAKAQEVTPQAQEVTPQAQANQVSPVEDKYAGKVFVSGKDLFQAIMNDTGEMITYKSKNNSTTIIYGQKEHPLEINDQFYDMDNQQGYYNVKILEKIFPLKYLSDISKYQILNGIITKK